MISLLVPALLLTALAGPADKRFSDPNHLKTPSFQRHVVPLLGRLGCNGRSCHGSFQGQGGFRLSLFGYDFAADHKALDSRIDRDDPAGSLLLRKATRATAHKGGKRINASSWEHRLLLAWLKGGAPAVKETALSNLMVDPAEVAFARPGQSTWLKVTAVWADGSREDVTPLCRFRSNDESVATVDPAGLVQGKGSGDTHVVAFYDNGIAAVPVFRPYSDRRPRVPTPTKVDELVAAKWSKLGLVPSEVCTDAEFLRRVSLDLTGTPPAAAEVTAFLADVSGDKRAKKVEELLKRPAYAAWWATRLCDVTGNSDKAGPLGGEQGLNAAKARQWYEWIRRRVEGNVGYDRLVEGIVLATGRQPGQSYDAYCEEMSSYFRAKDPADFSIRPTMPYFWTRRRLGAADAKALAFAHAFLGVRLECAQCHKHPYDQWTKQDFDQFTAFFDGVRHPTAPRPEAMARKKAVGLEMMDEDSGAYKRRFVALLGEGKVMHFRDLSVPAPSSRPRPGRARGVAGRVITPRLLGGDEVVARDYADPRRPVMDWMRQPDNPYFARSFVNRVWATYFHRGLVDPPDDLNLANPPTNRELLDHLAGGFVRSGFDMKWLHREILNSRTYQLSHRASDNNRLDTRHFSRHVPRRLPAEMVVDAVALATASDDARAAMEKDPAGKRAIGVATCISGRGVDDYATTLFGKPARALECDCERSAEPSLLQTVYLRNDREVLARIDHPNGWLRQVTRGKERDPATLVRHAYLRVLSRPPEAKELATAVAHLGETADPIAGLRDLLWVLLNTKEFLVVR